MLTPHSHINTCVAFCVLFLISLGGPQVFAPAPLRAQAGPPRSLQPPLPPQSAPAAPEMRDVSGLFRQICMKCHGADGTGSRVRRRYSEIPDFTNASWQARRTDAELTESILDGKVSAMPPLGDDVGEEQVRGLVAYYWWCCRQKRCGQVFPHSQPASAVRVAVVAAKSAAQHAIAHHAFLARSDNFRRSLGSMTPPNQ